MAVDRKRVSELVRELLEAIGEDPERPGLKLTPQRVADAYAEFFSGVGEDAAAPLAHTISVTRGPAPDTLPSGAVMLRDIRFRSVCEHHLLPFAGYAHVAYLPGEQVVGLGALPKVIDILAARPQVQERLGEQIADTIAGSIDTRVCSSCSTRCTSASRCAGDGSPRHPPSRSPRGACSPSPRTAPRPLRSSRAAARDSRHGSRQRHAGLVQ